MKLIFDMYKGISSFEEKIKNFDEEMNNYHTEHLKHLEEIGDYEGANNFLKLH